ncbi:helix-turn-helix transcriptional regulator [Thalassotalea fusca]
MFSFSNLVALGFIQGMILALYLFSVPGPGRSLAIFLLLLSINMCVNFYVDSGLFDASMLFLTIWESLNSYLLLGPLLMIFTLKMTNSEYRVTKGYFLHFLPFFSYALIHIVISPHELTSFVEVQTTQLQQAPNLPFDERFSIVPLTTALHFCLYLGFCSWVAFKFWLQHKEQNITNHIYWLLLVLIISYLMMFSVFVVSIVAVILNLEKSPVLLAYSNLSTVVGVFAITVLLMRTGRPVAISTPKDTTKVSEIASKLSDPTIEQRKLLRKLDHELNTNKFYLQPEFNQLYLAEKLEITRHQLSELLTFHSAGSFYELINQLRVEAVIKEIKTRPLHENLINIAFDCGFNSKSSFNKVFKKYTNKTPSQFRKAIKE